MIKWLIAHIVVVWVGSQASVEPLPSAPIDRILLILDSLGNDLGGEVVVKLAGEM